MKDLPEEVPNIFECSEETNRRINSQRHIPQEILNQMPFKDSPEAQTQCSEVEELKSRLAEAQAEIANIEQAITDPENQPSQYGTVTLEWHKQEMAELKACGEPVAWMLIRCDGFKILHLGAFTDDIYMDEGDEAFPLYLHPQDVSVLQDQFVLAREALAEIREVYAGSELGIAKYAQEAYAIARCKEQYQIACDALAAIQGETTSD